MSNWKVDESGKLTNNRKITNNLSDGITAIGIFIMLGILLIVVIATILIVTWILTTYIITFAHGMFVDMMLFDTNSIFTIPYNQVISIALSYGVWFWAVYIMVLLVMMIVKKITKDDKN